MRSRLSSASIAAQDLASDIVGTTQTPKGQAYPPLPRAEIDQLPNCWAA